MCIVDISELKHFSKEIHFSVLIVGLLSSKYRWLLETLPNGACLSLSSFSKTLPHSICTSQILPKPECLSGSSEQESLVLLINRPWMLVYVKGLLWSISILSAFITLQMLYLNSAYNKDVNVSDAEFIKNISDSLTRFRVTSIKFKYEGKGSNLQMIRLPSWIPCIQYGNFF